MLLNNLISILYASNGYIIFNKSGDILDFYKFREDIPDYYRDKKVIDVIVPGVIKCNDGTGKVFITIDF